MPYQLANAEGTTALRDDGATVPWDPQTNSPKDITGYAGSLWKEAGSPVPAPYVLPPPTGAEVDQERDERIAAGFMFNGKRFQSRPDDQQNISGAGALAIAAIMNGAQPGNLRWHGGTSDFAWIAADNTLMTMDAQTVIAFGQAAGNWKSAHVFASRALKDTGSPAGYKDDQHWPAKN